MVALPYKKFGLQVYESGINIVVEVPELGVVVTYNGLTFSVQLPYRLFGNNTKGQCGKHRTFPHSALGPSWPAHPLPWERAVSAEGTRSPAALLRLLQPSAGLPLEGDTGLCLAH